VLDIGLGSVAKMACWYCNSPALLPITGLKLVKSKGHKNDVRKQNCMSGPVPTTASRQASIRDR